MSLSLPWWRKPSFDFLFPDGTPEGEELSSLDPMQDVIENKNLFFQVLLMAGLLKFAKMPDGMKTIQTLGKEVIRGLFDSLDSLGQASSSNPVAAWANPVLISGVFERFGLLPPHFNRGYHKGITTIAGIDTGINILESIFGKGGAYPSSISLAKRNSTE